MHTQGSVYNPYRLFHGLHIPEWLAARPDVGDPEKLVFGRLSAFAGKSGIAWPALQTLADSLGWSRKKAQRSIRALEELNLIRRVPRVRNTHASTSNGYEFLWHQWIEGGVIFDLGGGDTGDPPGGDTGDPPGGDTGDPPVGGQGCHPMNWDSERSGSEGGGSPPLQGPMAFTEHYTPTSPPPRPTELQALGMKINAEIGRAMAWAPVDLDLLRVQVDRLGEDGVMAAVLEGKAFVIASKAPMAALLGTPRNRTKGVIGQYVPGRKEPSGTGVALPSIDEIRKILGKPPRVAV